MGVMTKFKKARASGGAYKYFEEGEHICTVNAIKQFEDRSNNECVAMDAVIMFTNSPLMHVGETRNWMTSEEKADVYAPNVKALLMAVHNMNEGEMDSMSDEDFEKLCEMTFGKEQAGAGAIVKVTTVKTKKKHAKKKDWADCTPDDVYHKNALEFVAVAGSTIEMVNGKPVITPPKI